MNKILLICTLLLSLGLSANNNFFGDQDVDVKVTVKSVYAKNGADNFTLWALDSDNDFYVIPEIECLHKKNPRSMSFPRKERKIGHGFTINEIKPGKTEIVGRYFKIPDFYIGDCVGRKGEVRFKLAVNDSFLFAVKLNESLLGKLSSKSIVKTDTMEIPNYISIKEGIAMSKIKVTYSLSLMKRDKGVPPVLIEKRIHSGHSFL